MDEQEIKKFSDDGLLFSLGGLLEQERKTNRMILLHLIEVSQRKLYAKRGFDSLYEMLVGHYKLSEGSANRRLQAMRILKDVPQAPESLVSGEVNLTTLSMTQIQIRQEEKLTGEKISIERKAEIVECIKNKTQAKAAVELFKQLPNTASQPRNIKKRISETETRLTQNFPNRVLEKLEKLREIWSHVNPNMDYVEIIERCADEALKRHDPTMKKTMPRRLASHRLNTVSTDQRPTYYRAHVKKEIYLNAESCCEFIDPKTGKRCRSKFLLQIDHKTPIWAGGTSELENLQLLCATHNKLKYAVETNKTFLLDRNQFYRIREKSRIAEVS